MKNGRLASDWGNILSGITESETGPIWPAEDAARTGDLYTGDLYHDRRGATGLANGLAISLVLWALIALVASLLFG